MQIASFFLCAPQEILQKSRVSFIKVAGYETKKSARLRFPQIQRSFGLRIVRRGIYLRSNAEGLLVYGDRAHRRRQEKPEIEIPKLFMPELSRKIRGCFRDGLSLH
jgi:hypothetical protein